MAIFLKMRKRRITKIGRYDEADVLGVDESVVRTQKRAWLRELLHRGGKTMEETRNRAIFQIWGLRHVISDLLSHYAFDAHNDQVVSRGAMRMHAEGNSALREQSHSKGCLLPKLFSKSRGTTPTQSTSSLVGLFNRRFSW